MTKRRGLQKRAAEALEPLGFKAISGTSFTRQAGKQLHFVGLQYGKFSSDITFNLGCHFQGLPSMSGYEAVTLDDLEDVNCGLRIRVGRYIGDGFYDIWWDPDNSEVPGALAQACWAIERAFDDCVKKWGSDGALILRSHVQTRSGAIRLSKPLLEWLSGKGGFERFAFVALLASHHGDAVMAHAFYEKALECKDSLIFPYVPKLAAALRIQERSPAKFAARSRSSSKKKSKRAGKQ
jgi:hypothetical protein